MKKYYPFLAAIGLALLYFGSAWLRPPSCPSETRQFEMAREMLASGEWSVPHLNGFPRPETPPPGVWLSALAMRGMGETPVAARLPGVLALFGSAGLLCWFGCRSGEERVGQVAAVIFLLSAQVFLVGIGSVPHAVFSFLLLLTMTLLYFGCLETSRGRRVGWLVPAGLGMGLAVLAGGAAALLLPLAALAGFLIWQKEWKKLGTLPWIPLGLALLIPAMRAVAVSAATENGCWREFLNAMFPARSAPLWPALPMAVAGMLPWVLFLPVVLAGYRGRGKEAFRTPLLRCAVCMGAVWPVLLAVAGTGPEAAAEMLPVFPAFAILLAWGLVRYAQSGKLCREADRVLHGILCCGIPALAGLFALQVIQRWLPGRIPRALLLYHAGENFYFPVFAAMVFLVWCGMARAAQTAAAKFACFCIATGFVALAYPALPPPHLVSDRTPVGFLAREVRRTLTPDTLILAGDRMVSATAWALRRADVGVYGEPGAFLRESRNPKWRNRFYSPERLAEIVKAANCPVLIVSNSEEQVRKMPAVSEKSYRRRGGLFIVRYRKPGEVTL